MRWIPGLMMPDIYMKDPVEGGLAAITNCGDPRVQKILADIPVLLQFVRKFTDAFGRRLRPSMLILREDAPKTFITVEAVASFRDLVAMSVVPISRAKSTTWGRSFGTYYSDWYDFYPWMINTQHQHLVCSTPAVSGLEVVDDFRGQGAPGLSTIDLGQGDFDTVLLEALITRWRKRYRTRSPTWRDRALFRSLDMAVAAAKMPAPSVDVTQFSLGRSVGLWVSAFEILAHPKIGRSETPLVYALLDKAPWLDKRLRQKRFKPFVSANRQKQKSAPLRSLPCWLYGALYHARNDFLHGNPVRLNRLHLRSSGKSLFQYAPLLYRMALSAFLQINHRQLVPPPATDTEAYGQYIATRIGRFGAQQDIERALLSTREKP
jgi:hypothetical protein